MRREAVSAAAAGYDVSFVVPAVSDEVYENVRIRAVPISSGRVKRMTLTAVRVLRRALQEDGDVYQFHDPELIPAGFLLKLLGKRVIYDVHENVALDVVSKEWLPGWLKPLIGSAINMLEALAGATFDHIVAATTAIERRFPNAKTSLIRNCPPMSAFATSSLSPFSHRPRNVSYVGGLADFNGVEQMVLAMGLLPQNAGIRLLLGGQFPTTEYESYIRALPGASHVDFLGWVEPALVPEIFGRSRAGLVPYQPEPNCIEAEPNKFFETMAGALPLIASDFPIWRSLIERHRCGVVFSAESPQALADAILHVVNSPEGAQAMGARGYQAVQDQYNWESQAITLIGIYDRLLRLDSLPFWAPLSA